MRCRFLFLSVLFLASPVFALQSYVANYEVSVRGVNAGVATYRFQFTPTSYEITATAKPSLAAKLLGFGEIREKATGKIQGNKVIPQSYMREMKGDDSFRLSYDYQQIQAGKITTFKDKTKKVLHFDNKKEYPLDILALIVQSLVDEENHRYAKSYTLLNEDKIRTYQVKALPKEQYVDKNNQISSLDVFIQTHGKRQTKIYFAAEPLRLVKLQQMKENESRFTLNLLNYKAL